MEALRRGKNVAIAGAVLQVVLTLLMLFHWLWSGSLTAMSATWLLAAGVPVWLVTAVLLYCRQLERREQIELAELGGGRAGGVFEGEDEQDQPAAARRRWFDKWVASSFTVAWAALHGAVAVLMLRYLVGRPTPVIPDPLRGVIFLAVAGFAAFLFGRYAIGMSTDRRWRLLRAPSSYLLVNVLVMVATMASLAAVHWTYRGLDVYLAYIAPAIQAVVAVELALNFVLDIYRPRVPGQEQRFSFDSRLLNIAAEPDKVGHSVAEALNYQFGFEVSRTWFYQLLQRAFVPLVLSGAAVLIAITSVVIVDAGEAAVVKHWGRLDPRRRTLGPGVHLKWPWPIETVRRFATAPLHDVRLGTGAERTTEEREQMIVKGVELYLWTQEHGRREERDFLVATKPRDIQTDAPNVRIIKLVVSVKYRIDDPYRYGYAFTEPDALLESIAYREMTHYVARATLDQPVGEEAGDRPEAIMTFGRARAARVLHEKIQAAVDAVNMGVEIVRVQIISAHPPQEAAPAFEEVLQAERQREQQRYQAQADANRALSAAAGDTRKALRLALEIRTVTDLQTLEVVRDDPQEFAARLETYVHEVTEEIEVLDKELAEQTRRGRAGEAVTDKRDLRRQYVRYRDFLRSIRDPGRFEFAAEIDRHRASAESMLADAGGKPVEIIEEAKVYRWTKELTVRAQVGEIARQIPSYRAAPQVYALDCYLDVWERYAPDLAKYVLGADREKIELWLDWEPKGRAGAGIRFDQGSPMGR